MVSHELLLVRVGKRAYGVPLGRVAEVVRMVALAPLPGAPGFLAGVVNLRGTPVAVVDLGSRVAEPSEAPVLSRRIVVVEAPSGLLGLLVDGAERIVHAEGVAVLRDKGSGDGGPAPSPLVEAVARAGPELVMVLDLAALEPAPAAP